jgi:nucleotide-binding universal stress UspA family protein
VSTLLIPSPSASCAGLPEDWPTHLAVAVDGREPSDVAIAAARTLAGSSAFRVVSVMTSGTSKDRQNEPPSGPPNPEAALAAIGRQLRRVLGDEHDAWIELRNGYPPAVLASFAELQGVPLLVVGIGRARVLDRLAGDESVLRLAKMMRTPLFAVAAGSAVPPRRVVIATDFGVTSSRVARLARALAAPAGELLLAHVSTPTGRVAPAGALRRQAEGLQAGYHGRVRPIELEGDAATELLALANSRGADAIAIGTHGEPSSDHGIRPALGTVASRVIRCSGCSLIVLPEQPA